MVREELRGELVTLRLLHAQYFDDYIAAFSPLVRVNLHCTSLISEVHYLTWALKQINQTKTFFYCMFDTVANQLIGAIQIRNPEQ